MVKVIADCTGCLHIRHPYEMGGLAFSLSMVWAQAFPFVALQFVEESDMTTKDAITLFLIGSFSVWLILNVAFFYIIDISYLGTFFGTQTAPQYTCEYFATSTQDYQWWAAVFSNWLSYTKSIHDDVKVWLAANIDRWKDEKPDWFNIELISDEFLPAAVIEAEGGKYRRQSSGFMREIIGGSDKVHPAPQ